MSVQVESRYIKHMAITLPCKTEPWARSDKRGGCIELIDLNGQLAAASVMTSMGRFVSIGCGTVHQLICAGTELAVLSDRGPTFIRC